MDIQLGVSHAHDLSVQGWSSVIPHFSFVDFASFYIEIPVMLVMYTTWMFVKRPYSQQGVSSNDTTTERNASKMRKTWDRIVYSDLVDIGTVDLRKDEHEEEPEDAADDAEREVKLQGRWRWLWKLYYVIV